MMRRRVVLSVIPLMALLLNCLPLASEEAPEVSEPPVVVEEEADPAGTEALPPGPDAEPEDGAVAEEVFVEEVKSGFLRWLGEELAAPLRETFEEQREQNALLQQEVLEMRAHMSGVEQELQQLRETLDLLVREVIEDLRADNEELRQTLAAARAGERTPRGYAGMSDEELARTVREHLGAKSVEPAVVNLSVEVVEEWGRTAEDAAQLGAATSTLKGLIGVVVPGAPYEALEQLARDLRAQYDNYHNINIEIFDDRAAAEGYQANQVRNPAHRVITVSKHTASGRDSIVVYHNGVPRQVR